jgi:hypothetical protein
MVPERYCSLAIHLLEPLDGGSMSTPTTGDADRSIMVACSPPQTDHLCRLELPAFRKLGSQRELAMALEQGHRLAAAVEQVSEHERGFRDALMPLQLRRCSPVELREVLLSGHAKRDRAAPAAKLG